VASWGSGETGGGVSRGSGYDNPPVGEDVLANNSPELLGSVVLVGGNKSLEDVGSLPVDGSGGGVSSSGSSMMGVVHHHDPLQLPRIRAFVMLVVVPFQPMAEAVGLLPLQAQPRQVETENGQEDSSEGERWKQQVGQQCMVLQVEEEAPFCRHSSWVAHWAMVHLQTYPNLQGH